MKSGHAKIYKHPDAGTVYITVSAAVASDSAFPLRSGEEAYAIIDGDNLVITSRPQLVPGKSGRK